jgi:chemotaxis protein CheC
MNEKIILSEDETDCLQELMNISYGSATAAISKIIDKFATLGIPSIRTISTDDLKKDLLARLENNQTFFMSHQLVNGNLSGQNLFIIDTKSAKNLAIEFGLEDDELIKEEIEDIVLEITNILSSTASSKLSALLNSQIGFSSPSIKHVTMEKDLERDFDYNYESVIVISTNLEFEDQNIHAELVFMKHKESLIFLKKQLGEFLDEY